MQEKFLKQIVGEVAGEAAEQLVALLINKKNVNEFLIAKKLGLTINQTRNVLYKLSNMGILSSIRKKDKRKGWYIYFWTFNVLRSLELLESQMEKEKEETEKELSKRKLERFYKCNLCGVEVVEEAAILTDFICSECGEVYHLSETQKHIQEITKKVNILIRSLNFIKKEREQEQEKANKKLGRQIKKKDDEKKKERAVKAKKRKKERDKEDRKNPKAKLKKDKARKLKKDRARKLKQKKSKKKKMKQKNKKKLSNVKDRTLNAKKKIIKKKGK